MYQFGLIGYPIAHSLSPSFFQTKWKEEGRDDCLYRLFPLRQLDALKELIASQPTLCGLNVTSPFKEEVLSYTDTLDRRATQLRSANVLCIRDGIISGHNTDVDGFAAMPLPDPLPREALVLGSGGAARAVETILREKGILVHMVSRHGTLNYRTLSPEMVSQCQLIVNATPLGMGSLENDAPDIPYAAITRRHHLLDLIYSPQETLFLQKGKMRGASTCNGLPMLYAQAEATWKIWKEFINKQ